MNNAARKRLDLGEEDRSAKAVIVQSSMANLAIRDGNNRILTQVFLGFRSQSPEKHLVYMLHPKCFVATRSILMHHPLAIVLLSF
jgi:hypothetical protein